MQDLLAAIFDRSVEAPIADPAEERAFIAAAQHGDADARERLILAYAPAVRAAVAQWSGTSRETPTGIDVDDLRQLALLGVLEAIQEFDTAEGDRLAGTVSRVIHRQISAQGSSASQFSIPDRTLTRFFGILRAAGGDVTEAVRIAPEHEMSVATFMSVLSALRDRVDLDSTPSLDDEARSGWDTVEASSFWDGNMVPDVEDRILVEVALASVDTLERDVVRLYYGFTEGDPVPDAEIAHRLGKTRPTVQRIRARALDTMRQRLGVA